MARTKPKRLSGQAEIERLIRGFGGRFSDAGNKRLINRVNLPSEEISDLKQEMASV